MMGPIGRVQKPLYGSVWGLDETMAVSCGPGFTYPLQPLIRPARRP